MALQPRRTGEVVGDAVFLASELLSTAGLMTRSEASEYNHRVAREGAGLEWQGHGFVAYPFARTGFSVSA